MSCKYKYAGVTPVGSTESMIAMAIGCLAEKVNSDIVFDAGRLS